MPPPPGRCPRNQRLLLTQVTGGHIWRVGSAGPRQEQPWPGRPPNTGSAYAKPLGLRFSSINGPGVRSQDLDGQGRRGDISVQVRESATTSEPETQPWAGHSGTHSLATAFMQELGHPTRPVLSLGPESANASPCFAAGLYPRS